MMMMNLNFDEDEKYWGRDCYLDFVAFVQNEKQLVEEIHSLYLLKSKEHEVKKQKLYL